jgi:hypothetical protein
MDYSTSYAGWARIEVALVLPLVRCVSASWRASFHGCHLLENSYLMYPHTGISDASRDTKGMVLQGCRYDNESSGICIAYKLGPYVNDMAGSGGAQRSPLIDADSTRRPAPSAWIDMQTSDTLSPDIGRWPDVWVIWRKKVRVGNQSLDARFPASARSAPPISTFAVGIRSHEQGSADYTALLSLPSLLSR